MMADVEMRRAPNRPPRTLLLVVSLSRVLQLEAGADAKTFVVVSNSFPALPGAVPILKSKSRVIKRDAEVEGWLAFIEGGAEGEGPGHLLQGDPTVAPPSGNRRPERDPQ